ncbi:zinc finger, CCHC-type containing protein [Tanacetum coccineum]
MSTFKLNDSDTIGLQVYTRKRKRVKTYDPDLNELDQFNAIFGIWLDPLAAIAAKLEAMESLKDDIADLKRQAVNKKSGGDPRGWRLKAEKYFRFYNTLDEEKADVTAMHLEGDALDLYIWMSAEHEIIYWEELINVLQKHFGPPEFQIPDEYLCSIKQTGFVHKYRQEFARRSVCISNWPDHCLLGVFLNGLKDELKADEIETSSLDIDPDKTAGISLHAILRKPHPTTMKIQGKLNSTEVLIFIDGGSTHNFILDILVSKLKLATELVAPFGVQIGNGDVIRRGQICKDLSLKVNDLKIIQDFHPFSLGGADLVLGIQWVIVRPLTVLTKKDGFVWSKEALLAFNTLKQALLTAPVLRLPDFSKTFVVECDASSKGVGAILSQDEHPVAYFSKGFYLSNRVKSAYDRELLALVLAVQKWNHYLLGRHFIVRIDHYTLKFLLEQRITSTEQQQLLFKFKPYDFSIHHQARKENRGADAFSRMPHSGELLTLTIPYCVEVADIKSGLQTDPFTSDIIQRLLSDQTAVPDFHLVEQFLFYKNCLVIPEVSNIKLKLLQEAHTTPLGGHGLLQPLPIPTQIWKDISMDFIVGLRPSCRFDTILVVVDCLSKYAYFICLSHPFTAKSVASVFCKEIEADLQPNSVISHRWVSEAGNLVLELLISWSNRPVKEATWESYDLIKEQFHNFCLEDKSFYQEGNNDTTGLHVYTRKQKWVKTYDPDLNELDQFNAIFGIWLDPLGQEKNKIVEWTESKDVIFNNNGFSLVSRPSLRIPKGTEDICGSVVPEKVTEEVVQQPEPELRKSKRNMTPNNFGPEFQLYLIEEQGMSIIRLLIAMASIHNLIIHQMDVKTAFLNDELDEEVDLTKEFLSSRFSIKNMGEADVILVSTPIDTSEKLMPNNGQAVSQLEYSRVIGCLIYAMTCTRPGITFVVGKVSRYTSNPGTQHWQAIQWVLKYLKKIMDYRLTYTGYPLVLEGYTNASWISNIEDNLSTSGWVFLLGGGAISWASKKQTCITGSTKKFEFVALAAAGKEAEWLKNLLLEIPLGSKPIAPIYICCYNAATLAKTLRSQENLADHLTKGLARDLVIKSVEGMGLKSN